MQMMGQVTTSESTIKVKNGFMRTDTTVNGVPQTMIIDVKGRRYISLNAGAREATVTDADAMAAQMAQAGASDLSLRLNPTGDTKSIAGLSCDGYTVTVSMTMNMGGQAMPMTMTGPAWSSKSAPGAKEYAAFMAMASDSGMFLVTPGQRGQGGGTAELMKKMAEAGLPCASEFEIGMGSGEMAAMMSQMGKSSMTNETTSVSTAPLDDSLFAIPDGYTIKKP